MPAKAGPIKARLLVMNGAADPFVKPGSIEAPHQEMKAAKVDYRFINYPGAVHAFTNPAATVNGEKFGIPLKYDPKADKQSWKELGKFLKSIFK